MSPTPMLRPRDWAWLSVALLLLQLPLALNPGYFSHDELQWASFARAGVATPWWDVGAFQYRPLTFHLWMTLSRALFDTPMLLHAVLVGWGTANALLLTALARGFGLGRGPAMLGALCFALSPFATYAHGWVGCIADLIWLSCALLIALAVQRLRHPGAGALVSAVLTAVALLGKEAAFAIPPLLAVAWWFDGRRHRWLWAMLAAGAVCALYLALRMDTLLHAPREGAQYALSLAHLPMRWLEYQIFPPIVPLLETFNTLSRKAPALLAFLLWLGLLSALWQASPRLLALHLCAGIAALLPVLPLASSFNHYAYGYAATAAMTVAAAWPLAHRRARLALAGFAVLSLLHGGYLMWQMHAIGHIQARFSPALAQAVRTAPAEVVLTIAPDAREWVFQRLSHAIPDYDGVAIGERVRITDNPAEAHYRVQADGRLVPLTPR